MNKHTAVLLGVSLESANRGVNALAIGSLSFIEHITGITNVAIIRLGKEDSISKIEVLLNGSTKDIVCYYVSKRTFLRSLWELATSRPQNKISKLIVNAEYIFNVNEGDSFSDIYGLKRFLICFGNSLLAILPKKRQVFLPQTIGPFSSLLGKFLSRWILKRVPQIYVRDEKGVEYLRGAGLNYKTHIDMAVFMEPKRVGITVPAGTIGINVNGLLYFNGYGEIKGKFDTYKELLYKIICSLLESDHNVLLIPHTYDAGQPIWEDDLVAIKDLAKTIGHSKLSYLDKNYDAQELKYIISQTEFFCGSRMHSCIAALSLSVPTIGLAYSYKFEGTFRMFEQSDYVMDIDNLQPSNIDSVVSKVLSKISNSAVIKQSLIKNNIERNYTVVEQ